MRQFRMEQDGAYYLFRNDAGGAAKLLDSGHTKFGIGDQEWGGVTSDHED